ncbi:MAG TPA: sugar ABC transporter substrate-binding protein [Gemmatimonadaceae bacterium]|nr:sugar ABC transporter substrate-binding protein [Gemmatimonadaceae bacterium]
MDPVPTGPTPLAVNLDHLRHLGIDVVVGGKPVRVISLYAEAPDYKPTASPARDGYEGIASLDDAARAAVAYLRAYEQTGDTLARNESLKLLNFVVAMEQGDGEFVNFVDAQGRLNFKAPSSRKSMSYWAARSIWALGEADRVLGPRDSALFTPMRPTLSRAVARLATEINAGRLIGGSSTATAEALLGLLALERAESPPGNAALAAQTAMLLVRLSNGNAFTAPWGARSESSTTDWHAWGTRSTEALAIASVVLKRPDFAAAAKREADGLWARFVMAGQVASSVSPNGTAVWFPQIAYGLGPVVEGYLALADATGDSKYSVFAGLAAAWFAGANPTGIAMYNAKTGLTFDGIDGPSPLKLNRNAGAESTIESLLALQAVTGDPEASQYIDYRPVGKLSTSLSSLPESREFADLHGARIVVRRGKAGLEIVQGASKSDVAKPQPITLTYWPAANPPETRLAVKLATQWNLENPDVQVRVQPLPAGRSTEEVLLAAIVARATPDVSSNVSSALLSRLVRANGVVRLDDRVATSARLRERTSPSMLSSLRLPDGGIYAFPWKTNPMMLMYNVDLLKEAGVAPPRNHTELLEACRLLIRDTNGDGRLDRWAFWATLKTTWYERFYDFYPLYLASSGGKTLVRDGKVVFENDAAVSALDVLRRGFDSGVLPRSNFALGRDPFMDGTVAMKIIGPWFVKELDERKVRGLHYDVTPIPAADGTPEGNRFAFADLRSIAIFSTTKHPEEAARFVAYLTSPAADRMLIEEASQLPFRRGLASDQRFATSLKRWPTLSTYAKYVERTRDIDLDPDIVEMFDLISEAYEESAVYGKVPVKQALARAAREATGIINAR